MKSILLSAGLPCLFFSILWLVLWPKQTVRYLKFQEGEPFWSITIWAYAAGALGTWSYLISKLATVL